MSAAKTTGALQAARRYHRQGASVLLIRPKRSIRAHETVNGHLMTKDGESWPSQEYERAGQIPCYSIEADVVWIDEPSLFEDDFDLPFVVNELRKRSIVLISGLAATSELEPFGEGMPLLLSVADDVIWLRADCDLCRKHDAATRSLFIGEEKEGQVHVGGKEVYRPVCPACWTNYTSASSDRRIEMLRKGCND